MPTFTMKKLTPNPVRLLPGAAVDVLTVPNVAGTRKTIEEISITNSTDNGASTVAATFGQANDVCQGPDGSLWWCDSTNNYVWRMWPDGTIRPVMGNTTAADAAGTANEFASAGQINAPKGICITPDGTTVYVATASHRIVKYDVATRTSSFFAGTGASGHTNNTGVLAAFNTPRGLALEPVANPTYMLVAEGGNYIRRVTLPGAVVTDLIGDGTAADLAGTGIAARVNSPFYIAFKSDGTAFYLTTNAGNRVHAVTYPGAVLTFLAGSGASADTDGIGTAAAFDAPRGIAITPDNTTLYVISGTNAILRRVTIATGAVVRASGAGNTHQNGNLDQGKMNTPHAISKTAGRGDRFVVACLGTIRSIDPALNFRLDTMCGTPGTTTPLAGTIGFNRPGFLGLWIVPLNATRSIEHRWLPTTVPPGAQRQWKTLQHLEAGDTLVMTGLGPGVSVLINGRDEVP